MSSFSEAFFTDSRRLFFRALSGKYREAVVVCVRELYRRLYSASHVDYGQALSREMILGLFQEVLVREQPMLQLALQSSVSDSTLDGEEPAAELALKEPTLKEPREQAIWILNQLLETGWLEKQADPVSLQSSYTFSRYGREFASPFAQAGRLSARTHHRNTRNTRNALESFLKHGDVHDLLDAHEYSERIITDFTDIIAELDERKRNLVQEMESQWQTRAVADAFFDFMENRFQPDLSVRLSADNVEKHRHVIERLILRIRRQDDAIKAGWERSLRALLPDLARPGHSLLWWLLEGIEHRLRNACDIMLPALRQALQGFTRRADIVIRQMSYLSGRRHNDVAALCQQLSAQPEAEQARRLAQAGALMALPHVGLVDPAQVKLLASRERTPANAPIQDENRLPALDERRQMFVQQALEQAFTVNQQSIRQHVEHCLTDGQAVSSRTFPVTSASEFLAVAHAIGLGAANASGSDEFQIEICPEAESDQEQAVADDPHAAFVHKDHFVFKLVRRADVGAS